MAQINFLQRGVRELRKSIIDIDDSYNNDWDVLAELTQNAVDAIRKGGNLPGRITIKINSLRKEIEVEDNGCGIDKESLPSLLAPFSSGKEVDDEAVGEKGVGLTFVMFRSNKFTIKTGTKNGASFATVTDASLWKQGNSQENIMVDTDDIDDSYFGTCVSLYDVEDSNIFQLSSIQMEYLLRTKTAIGNTKTIWGEDIRIDVTLKHTDLNGNYTEKLIPFSYWALIDKLDENTKISLSEYYDFSTRDRTDQEKRHKLQNKVITHKTPLNHGGRVINALVFYVPRRSTFEDISKDLQILPQEKSEREEFMDKFPYIGFTDGIQTSVKGMPTGILIDSPKTGSMSSWPQFFMLFEDRHLKFDIGRKSIHGMQSKTIREKAREVFNEFQKLFKYIGGEALITPDWSKDDLWAEIDSQIDLGSKVVKFKKSPRNQEASVAAIFYECIGNGSITGIDPIISGYKNKYDLYAKWGGARKIAIEFKAKLSNILKDFADEQKLFNEVDCIVCWDISEDDNQAFQNKGVVLAPWAESSLSGAASNKIPNATHILTLGMVKPIYVIDLKLIVKS